MKPARALPLIELMFAASSRNCPVATPHWVGAPERLSGRRFSPARCAGNTPSTIMSPDQCPWTQIRLGAGARHFAGTSTNPHIRRGRPMT